MVEDDIIEGTHYLFRAGFLKRQWRWHFRTPKGRIIYGSTENYKNKNDAIRSIPVLAGDSDRRWVEE